MSELWRYGFPLELEGRQRIKVCQGSDCLGKPQVDLFAEWRLTLEWN